MAIITDGSASSGLQIDSVAKAARATLYDALGNEIPQFGKLATFSVTTANFAPAATATDLFTISGSASKLVKVLSIGLTGTAGAASNIDAYLVKRSSANSGTSQPTTAVPHDATNSAATAVAVYYTTNPTLGTTVGTITKRKIMLPVTATAVYPVHNELLPIVNGVAQPVTLNSNTEFLAVNYGGVAIPATSANWAITCTWVEI